MSRTTDVTGNSISLSRRMPSAMRTSMTIGRMTIMSAPWDNTWNLVDSGKRRGIPARCLSLHYIEHNDVMDVRLEVSARNPKATEPYMSTIS